MSVRPDISQAVERHIQRLQVVAECFCTIMVVSALTPQSDNLISRDASFGGSARFAKLRNLAVAAVVAFDRSKVAAVQAIFGPLNAGTHPGLHPPRASLTHVAYLPPRAQL
jgi:hypothetical protein